MSLGIILLVAILSSQCTFGLSREKRQESMWSMPICKHGPLKCLLQFHKVLQFRFHYDFIKGVDRYVTGRDAIIEDKEIEEYIEESNIIEEELRHQEEIQQTHSLVSQEEEKYMNMLINFWQKANSHSITHLTDDEYLKGVKSYIDSYKS